MDYLLQNWGLILICLFIGSAFGLVACALVSSGERCDILMMERLLEENAKLRELTGENDLIE